MKGNVAAGAVERRSLTGSACRRVGRRLPNPAGCCVAAGRRRAASGYGREVSLGELRELGDACGCLGSNVCCLVMCWHPASSPRPRQRWRSRGGSCWWLLLRTLGVTSVKARLRKLVKICLFSTGLKSQNHRTVGVGRDLCGSPSPTSCPSRVTCSRL